MKPNLFKKGFKAVKDEQDRREKEKEQRKGKLWRFFLKENEEDVPLRFLTEEPLCYFEHSLNIAGKFTNVPCIGDGCKHCASKKPSYMASWLVIDGREVEVKERDANGKETGKTKIIKDQVKVLVRGVTTATQLDRLSRRYGLMGREWLVTRTGKDTNTVWNFDRGEETDLTKKQLENIMSKLSEEMQKLDPEEILMNQIQSEMDSANDSVDEDDEPAEDVKKSVKSKVQRLDKEDDEEDEEEKPVKKPLKKPLRKK